MESNPTHPSLMTELGYELRTPLSSIIGMAKLLSLNYLSTTQQAHVADILYESEHMLAWVDRLLESSPQASEASFDFRILLEAIVRTLSCQAYAKCVHLALKYRADAPTDVIGHKALMRQIILNLLGWAIEKTERGSVILKASCTLKQKDTVTFTLHIQDTGPLLSEKMLSDIAVYLQQEPRQRPYARSYSGINPSLIITTRHLWDIGGHMKVNSSPEEGNTVTCYVPFKSPPPHRTEPKKSLSKSSSALIPFTQKIRILMVEDNLIIQKVHNLVLDKLACETDIAENMQSALDLYTRKSYDLVFMDIGLPPVETGEDMTSSDGTETMCRIRKIEIASGAKRVPIIVVSAHGFEEDKAEFMAKGADEVLTKPVSPKQLREVIQKWVLNQADPMNPNGMT
jgi:CheY-like chemotaxis protein